MKNITGNTKKFGKKMYKFDTSYYSHSDAVKHAKAVRQRGASARVVEVAGGKFAVYKRS